MSTEYLQEAFVADDSIEWEQVGELVKRKIMAHDPSLMIVKVLFKEGGIGPIHKHFHSQTSYVENGKFKVTIGDETTVLGKGDVFYIAPNVLHGAICLEEGVLLDFFSPVREDFL